MAEASQGTDATSSDAPAIYPQLNRKLNWFKWLGFIGGIATTLVGTYQYQRSIQLREHGIKTEGTLVDSSSLNTGKGRRSYTVVIDFDSKENNQGFRKEFNVPEKTFNDVRRTG